MRSVCVSHDLFIKQFGLVFDNVFRRELGVSLSPQLLSFDLDDSTRASHSKRANQTNKVTLSDSCNLWKSCQSSWNSCNFATHANFVSHSTHTPRTLRQSVLTSLLLWLFFFCRYCRCGIKFWAVTCVCPVAVINRHPHDCCLVPVTIPWFQSQTTKLMKRKEAGEEEDHLVTILLQCNIQNNTFCTFPWWVHQHKEYEEG